MGKMSSVISSKKNAGKEVNFSHYDFRGLFAKVLSGVSVDKKLVYLGKLTIHKETVKKSKKLIEKQRTLKTHLEEQGFEVIIAGRVRGHAETCPKGHQTLTFKEKGVDVRIVVDMITLACQKELSTAIIASSDSDLQPAIHELARQNIERIYLGFEVQPNKGLTYTTDRTILIRNSEVEEFVVPRNSV